MDSQGRNRLIIGALTLAAVILVISLLTTQQGAWLPVAVESPLVNEGVVATPAQQEVSPLAAPVSNSPLAAPHAGTEVGIASSSLSATDTLSTTDALSSTSSATETTHHAITGTRNITEGDEVTPPVAMTATSTVTVTLVATQPLRYDYEVVESYPHDPEAFTQGLQYVEGDLYEGTGLNGASSLRRVALETGEVEQQVDLPEQYFGEGIVVIEDRIYQLTWQSNVAFLYDRESFELLDEFDYPTEGWGLTYDGQDLLMSDGSSTIYRRDPETFAEVGRIEVLDGTDAVPRLNELEYIDNLIWANIWLTDEIVMIDPVSGQVVARLDLTGLLPSEAQADADVLNGIAYDEANDRIFVTGKLWPTLFEIELIPR
jgi:glutaminyl-peptide cyclotransferase